MSEFDDADIPEPENDGLVHCAEPDCEATIKSHAWGKIKSGWFFAKDGASFCAEHTPEWVAGWRKSRALEHRQSR